MQTAWNGIYPRWAADVPGILRRCLQTGAGCKPYDPGDCAQHVGGAVPGLFFDNVEPEYSQTITTTPTTPVTYTVSGRVTSTSGAGIAGAVVYFSDTPNAAVSPLITATADANGYYTRTLPTPSSWYVAAGAAAFNASADQTVTVNGADVGNINFTVVPNSRLSGKVTKRTDGTAISGATVYFSTMPNASLNPTFTTTTDSSGNFSQLLQNGTWYISASATGYFPSADKTLTINSADVSGLGLTWRPTPETSRRRRTCCSLRYRFVPGQRQHGQLGPHIFRRVELTAIGSPTVDVIDGIKWERTTA